MSASSMPVKHKFFILNSIVVVLGLAVMIVGMLTTLYDYIGTERILSNYTVTLGIFICMLAIIGYCAAITENSDLLSAYVLLSAVFIVFQLSVAVFSLNGIDDFEITDELTLTMRYSPSAMDVIQEDLQCCGVNGPRDYPTTLPQSCLNYQDGCKQKITDRLEPVVSSITGITIIGVLIQAVAAGYGWHHRFSMGYYF